MRKTTILTLLLLLASATIYAQTAKSIKDLDNGTRGKEITRPDSRHDIQPNQESQSGAINPVSSQPVERTATRTDAKTNYDHLPTLETSINKGSGERAYTDLTCPDWTIYSQAPNDTWAHTVLGDNAIYDNILTAPGAPVISMTWWMAEWYSEPSLTFDIIIREDAGGVPDFINPPKAIYTNLTIPGSNTGEFFSSHPVYSYQYYFPDPITINAGDWIGIEDYPNDGYHHYWIGSLDGDGQFYREGIEDTYADLSICLGGRESDLICPDESIYSQTPDGLNGWYSYLGAIDYDNVLSAPGGLVGSITFWWAEDDMDPGDILTFDIIIRYDNGGVPGTLKASYTNLTIPGVPTGELLLGIYPIYSYTYDLPAPITINAGDWIGIADFPDDYIHHYWLTSSDGDGIGMAWTTDYWDTGTDYAFCLGEFDFGEECPAESIYAQTPNGIDGWSSTDGLVFYDNVLSSLSDPVGSLTWWMIEGYPVPTLTFDIIIRNPGAIPGSVKASFTNLTVTGVNTGKLIAGLPVYSYTYNFPYSISIGVGDWVGIADYPNDLGIHHHYWCLSSDGDGSSYWYQPPDNNHTFDSDFAFCFGPGEPVVPLSNWAIGIGIFLIIAFTVFRFRRA